MSGRRSKVERGGAAGGAAKAEARCPDATRECGVVTHIDPEGVNVVCAVPVGAGRGSSQSIVSLGSAGPREDVLDGSRRGAGRRPHRREDDLGANRGGVYAREDGGDEREGGEEAHGGEKERGEMDGAEKR